MKLCYENDLPDDGQRLRCHQSRLAGVVGFIVWCGVLSLPPILGWRYDLPWVKWLGIQLAAVLIPILLVDTVARFRATNWVLQIGVDGVWINLRSYQDKQSAAPSVLHLDFGDIASAGSHVETYSTPSESKRTGTQGTVGGTTYWHAKFLEIQFVDEQPAELIAAVISLKNQPGQQPPSGVQLRKRPFPLWFVSPSLLRIAWVSSHGQLIIPRLAKVLDFLGTYVQIATPTRRDWPRWRDLNANEVKELAHDLVNIHGEDFAAGYLLVQVGGVTQTEAWKLTRKFAEEESTW